MLPILMVWDTPSTTWVFQLGRLNETSRGVVLMLKATVFDNGRYLR